jgi:hypothetical protein
VNCGPGGEGFRLRIIVDDDRMTDDEELIRDR